MLFTDENTSWGLSTSMAATWRATEALSFEISYALRFGFRYPIASIVDENSCKTLTSTGESACQGGRASDLSIASIQANYQFSDHWGVAVFLYTAQNPTTPDGKALRFPFWAFEESYCQNGQCRSTSRAAGNYSSVGVSLSASF